MELRSLQMHRRPPASSTKPGECFKQTYVGPYVVVARVLIGDL
jgi:hypothetical protein